MNTKHQIAITVMTTLAAGAHAQSTSQLCDIALIMPGTSIWHMDTGRGGGFGVATQLGANGDQYLAGEPIAAWRDGRDEVISFRSGQWTVKRNANGGYSESVTTVSYGAAGDRAVIGDFDGDGIPELGVLFSTTSRRPGPPPPLVHPEFMCLRLDLNHNLREDESGQVLRLTLEPRDRVVTGKFGAFGCDDLAIWRDATGNWEIYLSLGRTYGSPTFSPTPIVTQFGLPGDLPMTGDVNGDGHADLMVFRPSDNRVYVNLWEWNAFLGWPGILGPNGDVDRIIDYSWSIGLVNQATRHAGMPWNSGVVALRVD